MKLNFDLPFYFCFIFEYVCWWWQWFVHSCLFTFNLHNQFPEFPFDFYLRVAHFAFCQCYFASNTDKLLDRMYEINSVYALALIVYDYGVVFDSLDAHKHPLSCCTIVCFRCRSHFRTLWSFALAFQKLDKAGPWNLANSAAIFEKRNNQLFQALNHVE